MTPTYQVDMNEKLGRGGFGTVFPCINVDSPSEPLVLKLFRRDNVGKRINDAAREYAFAQFVTALLDDGNYNVYEYDLLIDINRYQEFDVPNFLTSTPEKTALVGIIFSRATTTAYTLFDDKCALSGTRIAELYLDLARQIRVLHDNGLAHNDVKPSNIAYKNLRLQLIDYGLACAYKTAQRDAPAEISKICETHLKTAGLSVRMTRSSDAAVVRVRDRLASGIRGVDLDFVCTDRDKGRSHYPYYVPKGTSYMDAVFPDARAVQSNDVYGWAMSLLLALSDKTIAGRRGTMWHEQLHEVYLSARRKWGAQLPALFDKIPAWLGYKRQNYEKIVFSQKHLASIYSVSIEEVISGVETAI
jgi:serine/threonine protein kinase